MADEMVADLRALANCEFNDVKASTPWKAADKIEQLQAALKSVCDAYEATQYFDAGLLAEARRVLGEA